MREGAIPLYLPITCFFPISTVLWDHRGGTSKYRRRSREGGEKEKGEGRRLFFFRPYSGPLHVATMAFNPGPSSS